MAIISGKSKIEYNGIDLGEMTFFEVQPHPMCKCVPVEMPKAVELTVNVEWRADAMLAITDLLLQSKLGEHYKN